MGLIPVSPLIQRIPCEVTQKGKLTSRNVVDSAHKLVAARDLGRKKAVINRAGRLHPLEDDLCEEAPNGWDSRGNVADRLGLGPTVDRLPS